MSDSYCATCFQRFGEDHGQLYEEFWLCSETGMWTKTSEKPEATLHVEAATTHNESDIGAMAPTSADSYPPWDDVLEMQSVTENKESNAAHAMFLFHESVLGFNVENEQVQDVYKASSGTPARAEPTKVTSRPPVSSGICSAAYLATPL